VESVADKVALGKAFLRLLLFYPVNIFPSWLSILIYHLGMNKRPVGGLSSETQHHPIDMNNNGLDDHILIHGEGRSILCVIISLLPNIDWGLFLLRQGGQRMKLTIQFHLMLYLRRHGSSHPLCLHTDSLVHRQRDFTFLTK
jgi:hypothetical protein